MKRARPVFALLVFLLMCLIFGQELYRTKLAVLDAEWREFLLKSHISRLERELKEYRR